MATISKYDGTMLSCKDVQTRNWHAWNNLMPPAPYSFIVTGEVETPNLGVAVSLIPSTPQGINPRILMLDLVLVQRPGAWPEVVSFQPARFERPISAPMYDEVSIMCEGEVIAGMTVQDVH